MNRVVDEQLKQCKVADIPPYDTTTTHLRIPKKRGIVKDALQEGNCYLIQMASYILNPPDNFTLHDNWNKGVKPIHQFMKCEVVKIMGKMVKVNGVGYKYDTKEDTTDLWEGWLPRESIKIIEVL